MNRWYKFTVELALAGMMLMALIAMWGWVSHTTRLVQVRPHYALIQFNTALCMFTLALAMLALIERHARLPQALALLVLVVSGLTLLEYVAGVGLGIDTLLMNPFMTATASTPGRMGVNAALALFIAALSILALSQARLSPKAATLVGLGGSAVFALGTVPLLGYVSGIEEAYRFGMFTRMSLPSSCCFLLLGPIITLYAAHRSRTLHQWLPLIGFFSLATISLAVSIAVDIHEREQIRRLLQERVDERAADYAGRLQDLYGALNRIALRWEAADGTPERLWRADVESYRQDVPYLAGISWLDADGRLQWISPEAGSEKLIGRKLTEDPARAPTILRAIREQAAQVTPPVQLFYNHGLGYLYVRPLMVHGAYGGTLVSVITIPKMIDTLSRKGGNEDDYYYALDYHGNRLVSDFPSNDKALAAWKVTAEFPNLNERYQLVLYPRRSFLAAQQSRVAAAVFGVGFLLSLLVALTIKLLLRERRQASLLSTAEQFNRTITTSASYLIIAVDTQGTVLLFNPEAERALGYAAEEIVGQTTPMLWHDAAQVEDYLRQLRLQTGKEQLTGMDAFTYEALHYGRSEQEWSFTRKDGTAFPGRLSVTPRRDGQGNLLGFLGIVKDMTQQKQQEARLRSSEETFRLAMAYSSVGMALVSPNGRWLEVNQALCDIVGYEREELRATNFQTITHPDDLQADLELVQEMIEGKRKSYQLEKRYFHKLGHEIRILLSVSLVRHEDGSPKYFISMIQDISDREKLIAQLQQTNVELEQFAYVASHDLQEPLRMVTSFVGLIGTQYGNMLDAAGHEYINIAVEAAKRMQLLITDLLAYARIGRESQLTTDIDCDVEMHHVLLNLGNAIQGAKADIDIGPMPVIRGNPVEFLRLMQNLIGNGIKFHRPGVTPAIKVRAVQQGTEWVFTVADNGIGLKPDYYERIFQPFKRLHTQQEYQGSGIGLAVCRKIVENLGGRIWVDSVLGEGTKISFTVPVITKGNL